MDIGPNLTSVILQLLTLLGVIVAGLFGHFNRKGISDIKDGITERADEAQASQRQAEIALSQLAGRTAEIQKQVIETAARHVTEISNAHAQGVSDEKATKNSGFTPL